MLNLYQHVGWETLKDDLQAGAAEGCKVAVVDPLTNLTNGMEQLLPTQCCRGWPKSCPALALDLNIPHLSLLSTAVTLRAVSPMSVVVKFCLANSLVAVLWPAVVTTCGA